MPAVSQPQIYLILQQRENFQRRKNDFSALMFLALKGRGKKWILPQDHKKRFSPPPTETFLNEKWRH